MSKRMGSAVRIEIQLILHPKLAQGIQIKLEAVVRKPGWLSKYYRQCYFNNILLKHLFIFCSDIVSNLH